MKYYHYTQKSNISSILSSKKLEDKGFGVYVCNSIDNLLKFINVYLRNKLILKEDIVVLKFNSKANFEESFDHNPMYFNGAKALVCYDTVTISNIKIMTFN